MDPLDAWIEEEDKATQDGFREGQTVGQREGQQEGYQLGLEHGFQLGLEIGFYEEQVREQLMTRPIERVRVLLLALQQELETCLSDSTVLSRVRVRVKRIHSLLPQFVLYPGSQQSHDLGEELSEAF